MIKKIRLIAGLTPLIIGGLIYILYRADTLIMFRWFERAGGEYIIAHLRRNETLNSFDLPNWVKYNLPDAFFFFSLTFLLLMVWDFKLNKYSMFWYTASTSIGVLSEIGQFFKIIPGTFDRLDLMFLVFFSVLPFVFVIINIQKNSAHDQ